ncbi:MAG: HAMP domain-containing histidine kinase [Lachnospiraceae bacterium]|nr:HAMP domain-containing histidine kinase [Lachnospiraceae bacterium]
MKKSLKFKITLILISVMALLIILCWILNEVFLEKYYLRSKINSIKDSYTLVNSLSDADADDYYDGIERIETQYSVNVYIVSEINTFMGRVGFKYMYPISADVNDFGSFSIFRNDRFDRIGRALQLYIFNNSTERDDRGESAERLDTLDQHYDVYRFYEKAQESSYIDLVGFLDSGYLIFIRSGYENIQESVKISSKFFAIVGLFTIIIGSIVMLVFSSTFTKPILELADISDRMAKLDFESRYEDTKREDEIGRLGNSINEMSEQLESTITELKSANIELEKDIAHKIRIDEMRKEFLSNVSHELKTPIALIQGYAEGLKDNVNEDPEDRDFYCDVIIDESRKMNNMVKKLLSLNEIEFGSNKLNLERFDIVMMVRGISASIDILAKSKEIKVVFNESDPIYVWADQSLIEEVVTNYISNAMNYASGQKIVDIGFRETEDTVRVSVFNTGSNIPEESIDSIWDKFYKVDKARTREYGGSGIGLSIVKAIMEQHNQAYGVINHTTGVEFWFELEKVKENS